ncbi:uncharacterized protein LOC135393424 [Ornithodoros turicata]|uniref:uncharacterized protein LOC135393424 n=1 Tax=Ornithodoros turicata TaxID=34597 RepID=UPI0031399F82
MLPWQQRSRSSQRCPLDKQGFLESEVVISPVRTTPLQKLEVQCCNSNHGCSFVGSLERMKSHFLKDCEFHVLACKKCCATVLRKDIITHYVEEQCGAQNTLCPSEDVCIDRSVVGIGREINASLTDIADKLRAIEDHLNSHTVGIDATKECVINNAGALRTLQEGQSVSSVTMSNVITGMRKVTEALSSIEGQRSNADDVKNRVIAFGKMLSTIAGLQKDVAKNVVNSDDRWKQCARTLEAMSKRIQDLSSSTEDQFSCMKEIIRAPRATIGRGTNVAFFHVQDVGEQRNKAIEEGVACTHSDVFVLCGYSVQLVAKFATYDGTVNIGIFLRICRGSKDSLLKWPFLFSYKLILVHPIADKKNIEYIIDVRDRFSKFPQYFNRPAKSSNMDFGQSGLCRFGDALNGGFVHENSITVGVSLVQSRE